MVKEWPKENPRTTLVRISDPAMQWHELDLDDLLATCRRELARREFVYPKRAAEGSMTDKKAEAEIAGMRDVVDFLVHCIFKAVTRQAPPSVTSASEAVAEAGALARGQGQSR